MLYDTNLIYLFKMTNGREFCNKIVFNLFPKSIFKIRFTERQEEENIWP